MSKALELLNEINNHEKRWSDMSDTERRKAYNVAIKSGSVKDTFDGFSKQMHRAIFNAKTGEPIEV